MLAILVALAAAVPPPLGLRVEVEPLGRGPQGTVVGVAIQVAPEDLARAGKRLRVSLALLHNGAAVDAGDAVVDLQPDGSAIVYRDWPVGEGELRLQVASLDGTGARRVVGPGGGTGDGAAVRAGRRLGARRGRPRAVSAGGRCGALQASGALGRDRGARARGGGPGGDGPRRVLPGRGASLPAPAPTVDGGGCARHGGEEDDG